MEITSRSDLKEAEEELKALNDATEYMDQFGAKEAVENRIEALSWAINAFLHPELKETSQSIDRAQRPSKKVSIYEIDGNK